MNKVLSSFAMRDSDAATIAGGVSGRELMLRAAKGIYNSARFEGRVAIVCGSGNNAGDGYALALLLADGGIVPELILLYDKFSEDSKYYFEKCKQAGVPYSFFNSKKELSGYQTVVDCIFGTGFHGSPTGIARDAIEAINSSGAYVVSADINSGLDSDSGMGDFIVKSDLTVSVGFYKSGHFLGRAKDFIKKLVNCDIGIEPTSSPYCRIEPCDLFPLFEERKNFSHKGSFGYITLIGGSMCYGGAVKLSNLAASALRSGCGVARLAAPRSIAPSLTPYLLESTYYPMPDDGEGNIVFSERDIDAAISGTSAVAVGMGIGKSRAVYDTVEYILKNYDRSVIIDADALNSVAEYGLSVFKNKRGTVVLTPHLLEFSRLCGKDRESILENPIKHAVEFAREWGVILLLKGPSTVITDGKDVYISDSGCAGMATAGSGDVLSGILAALLARCDTCGVLATLATAGGAYLNGLAGEIAQARVGDVCMTASDTVSAIPSAVKKIREVK